jgi:hypothetical protein
MTNLFSLIFFLNLEWNVCSKSCGGGIQKRKCLNNNEKCNECLEEVRVCNEFPCPSMFNKTIEIVYGMSLFS